MRIAVGRLAIAFVRRRLALIAVTALGATASTVERAGAEDPAKPSGGPHRCAVVGRIVDGDENGVPGAKVAWIGYATAGDRSTGESVRTDDAGRFRLELDGPDDDEVRGTIHATRGDEFAALALVVVGVGTREKDAGSLALEAARPLYVDVRRDGAPVPGAQVWLWPGGWFSSGSSVAFVGTATTDESGRAEFAALPAAYMNLYARAPDGAVGHETISSVVPGSSPSRVGVSLVASRAVDVLVTTDDSPAVPIPGATVVRRHPYQLGTCFGGRFGALVPDVIAPTAKDGHTRVDGLLPYGVELEARIQGRPVGTAECKADETSVTIVIHKPTTFVVEEGERPPPPDGTKLVVVRSWLSGFIVPGRKSVAGGVEGWMANGSLVVPLTAYEISSGLAIAPDGSLAPLERFRPTSFFRPRALAVRLVEADGKGIAGAMVWLTSSLAARGPWETPIATDDEGRVRFDGLAPGQHFVHAFPTAKNRHGSRLAEVNLPLGDETREIVVGAEGTLLAHVTIEGEPAIPEGFRWRIPSGIVLESAVDRAGGTVRMRARAEHGKTASGSIELEGKGVRPRMISFPWPVRGGTTAIEVPLWKSPEVVIEVRADRETNVHVDVETWSPSLGGNWHWLDPLLDPRRTGRTNVDLPQGRYRLRDAWTGIVSEVFDVPDRGGKVEATLDLTGLVTVRGHIECPNPDDADLVELLIDGEGIDPRSPQIPGGRTHGMTYDGKSFALRIPAGRRVTLSAWHPTLQPAREGGEVTLVGPRDDVVLEMGDGASLVARLADAGGRPLSADEIRGAAIHATPAVHPGREAVMRPATAAAGKAGTVSASGFPFGSLDVWVEARGFAARRLERTSVTQDTTDLGEVRLTQGTQVLLRGIWKSGDHLPPGKVGGHALGMFGPRLYRVLESVGGNTGVFGKFTELGAGHWRIEVDWLHDAPGGQVREERMFEIDVDGEHEQTLDVEFD